MIASIAELEKYTSVHPEDSGELQVFIDSAFGIVINYLGYDPEYKTQTAIVHGYGTKKLKLSHKPVNRVYRVTDYETGEILYENRGGKGDYITAEEFAVFKTVTFPERPLEVEYLSGWMFSSGRLRVISGGRAGTPGYSLLIDCGDSSADYSSRAIAGGSSLDAEPAVSGAVPTAPALFRQTVLRIAALLLTESNNNIGATSKSFGDSGSRTFVNYTNFDKYLSPLSKYKLVVI